MKGMALLVIDVQKGFKEQFFGSRNNPQAEANISKLISFFRVKHLPVIFIQHASVNEKSPLHPNHAGFELQEGFLPLAYEYHFTKQVNSAFIGTPLEETLKSLNISKLMICGLTTNHCVSTSVRMAANLGFDVCLIEDATAAFETVSYNGRCYSAQEVHESALSHLHEEFAHIMSTEEVLRLKNLEILNK